MDVRVTDRFTCSELRKEIAIDDIITLVQQHRITVARVLSLMIIARSKLRKVLLVALSVTFLMVSESNISELLNGFAPNSQGRRVWSLAGTSLNIKVKGQGHQGQNCVVHSHHPRQ